MNNAKDLVQLSEDVRTLFLRLSTPEGAPTRFDDANTAELWNAIFFYGGVHNEGCVRALDSIGNAVVVIEGNGYAVHKYNPFGTVPDIAPTAHHAAAVLVYWLVDATAEYHFERGDTVLQMFKAISECWKESPPDEEEIAGMLARLERERILFAHHHVRRDEHDNGMTTDTLKTLRTDLGFSASDNRALKRLAEGAAYEWPQSGQGRGFLTITEAISICESVARNPRTNEPQRRLAEAKISQYKRGFTG